MRIRKTAIPPRGWNSYDSFLGAITEDEANANLDLFIEKLKPAGYEYFCLDAGWYFDGSMTDHIQMRAANQFRRWNVNEYGCYTASPVNFPHGLKALADRCHDNGLKFGVHMMRGMPLPALQLNTVIKGTNYRAEDIYDPDNFCHWCQYWVSIKTDHPGSLAFYKSEIEYLTGEIGVDFIKLDDVTEHPDHIALFSKALDMVDRPVLLSLSPGGETCPENWDSYRANANMIRVSRDMWDQDEENYLRLQKWHEFQNYGDPLLWVDLDMLPLGGMMSNVSPECPYAGGSRRQSRMTPRSKRMMMTIMAMSCSPLFFGGDLTVTPQQDIEVATNPEMLACNANGVVGKRVSFHRHLDIRKAVKNDGSAHGWIGIFNMSGEDRNFTITASDLGFDHIPDFFDIWNDRPLQPDSKDKMTVYMLVDDVLFLKY